MISPYIKRFLAQYASQRKGLFFLAIALSILQSLMIFPSLYLIREIFDKHIPAKDYNGLVISALGILGITLVQSFLSLVHRNTFLKTVKSAIKRLQYGLSDKLVRAPRKFYDQYEESRLVNHMVLDIEVIDMTMDGLLSVIIPQACLLGVGVITLLVYNPVIGMASLGIGLLGFVLQRFLRKSVMQKIKDYTSTKDEMADYAQALPVRNLLAKIRNEEVQESAKSKTIIDQLVAKGILAAKAGWNIRLTNDLIINFAAILLILLGAGQVLSGAISYGGIFALYFLIVFIRRALTAIQLQWRGYREGLVSLERIFSLLDSEFIQEKTGQEGLSVGFTGALKMEKVSFYYEPSHLILKEVDFHIEPGEVVFLAGENGSGKSSLVNLILGLYQPELGRISICDYDFDQVDLGYLRKQIGYVPQKQQLITGSLYENLILGGHEESVRKFRIFSQSAIYDQLMTVFEKGLETRVKTGGKNLSGGQIQRISIIRALMYEPRLLILDEPTNHLDSRAVMDLINQLRQLTFAISILIISHHEVFGQMADRSYLLTDKKLVAL